MRMILTTAAVLSMVGLAAFAQQQNPPQNPPQNPQPVPQSPSNNRSQDRDARPSPDKSMTAQEAAEMFRTGKHSLAESIGIAERQGSGKAVAARCCMKSQDELTTWRSNEAKPSPAGQPEIQRGGTPSGANEQKRDAQGRDIKDQSRAATGEKGLVCVVTCLVGDNRLVEYVVCSKSNQVVAERSIDSISGTYSQATDER